MNETDQLSNNDLILALEARKKALSPAEKARLSAVAAVTETRDDVGSTVAGDEPASGTQPDKKADKPDLSTEQMAELLTAVEHNLNNPPDYYEHPEHLPRLQQNVTSEEVRVCLENDPALAKQVYAMLERDGRPDVWSRHGKSFLFFESVQNTCEASRNCVYGKAQAAWLIKNRPNEQFNGSVEKQREDMGDVGVIVQKMWYDLQKLGSFTNDSWEWTDSDDINDDTPTGYARFAYRRGGEPYVDEGYAGSHRPVGGWRAVAKGSKA